MRQSDGPVGDSVAGGTVVPLRPGGQGSHGSHKSRGSSGSAGTLAALADRLETAQFVGRRRELSRFDALLASAEGRVALVHGPGGIGKSALLREIARRARAAGRPVVSVDLRDCVPTPEALQPLFAADQAARPVVLLDTFEHVAALGSYLRADVLPSLPADALVVVASRLPPEPAWRAGALAPLVEVLALAPLDARDSRALLEAHGLVDTAAVDAALSWTGGFPLGLVLAAEFDSPASVLPPEAAAAELITRLLEEPYPADRARLEALVLASIARVTTPDLLAAVLPRADTTELWSWLAARAFMTRSGHGVAPHELVARSVRTVVRAHAPLVEHDVRRRAIDALAADATTGGSTGVADLMALVDNPTLRWAFGVNSTAYYLDEVRPGDSDLIVDQPAPRVAPNASRLRRWLGTRPSPVFVVRDHERAVVGVGLAFSTATAPAEAWTDPDVGRFLRHAAAAHPAGEVVIWLCSETVDEDPAGHVQGLLGIGGHLVTATRNPVASYIPISPDQPEAVAFARESNGVRVPELDTVLDDGSPLHTYRIGDGPGGVVERIHKTVYAELGIPFGRRRPTSAPRVTAEDVRAGLRALWDDARLADSPVAAALSGSAASPDESAAARADRTRRALITAIEHAVGHESDVYRVVQESFLRRPGETVADPLPVSRATRYRLLRRALDAVAADLSESH